MKKLNRKGFTLVELLAVIIILAIVVGITIPAVLTTTANAKEKAFQAAADAAADWIDRQYQIIETGIDGAGLTVDSSFVAPTANGGCGSDASSCVGDQFVEVSGGIIPAAGLKASNIAKMEVKINSTTKRSCVRLTGAGDYSGTKTGGTNC